MVQHYDIYSTTTKNVTLRFDTHLPSFASGMDFSPEVDTVYPISRRRRFFYTAVSYILSSSAARHLVSLVEAHGIVTAADVTLMKLMDLVAGCYTLNPLLIGYPVPEDAMQHSDDTDIQNSQLRVNNAPMMPITKPWMLCL